MEHDPAQDQAPFFLTTNKLTLFAVDGVTDITFDCEHIHKAGPDLRKTLEQRGNFTIPDGCAFSTDLMQFANPISHVLDPKAAPITTMFQANTPAVYNFPNEPFKANIKVRNVTSRLLSKNNPTNQASNHYLL